MAIQINKDVLEDLVNEEVREVTTIPCCYKGRFGIYAGPGYQVQIVVTRYADEFLPIQKGCTVDSDS